MKNILYSLCLKSAHLYFKSYNFIFSPLTLGVRGIVLNSQNKVLLVKHRYDEKWYLPGGQVKKNETLSQALERELKEETSISFNETTKIEIFGCYSSFYQRKNDHIMLFIIKGACTTFSKECIEIKDADFFALDDLPSPLSPGTCRRLHEYKNNLKEKNNIW